MRCRAPALSLQIAIPIDINTDAAIASTSSGRAGRPSRACRMAIANTPTVKATAISVAAAAWRIGISFRATSATFVEQSTQRVDNFADGLLVRLRPRCVVHEDTISGKHQHVG